MGLSRLKYDRIRAEARRPHRHGKRLAGVPSAAQIEQNMVVLIYETVGAFAVRQAFTEMLGAA